MGCAEAGAFVSKTDKIISRGSAEFAANFNSYELGFKTRAETYAFLRDLRVSARDAF